MQEKLLKNVEKNNDLGWFTVILLALFTFFLFLNNFIIVVRVDGSSMKNTLKDGDVLFVSKNYEIDRGDVIVFDRYSSKLIKRVIAVEGDQVYAENGVVYLKKVGETDFTAIVEDYARGVTYDFELVNVESGYIFVLGDNRENSQDSRIFGTVSLEKVNGEVSSITIKNKSVLTFLLGWAFDLNEFFGGIL